MAQHTREQKTDSFVVLDRKGQEHVVDEYTTFVFVTLLSGETSRSTGSKRYELRANVHHLNTDPDGSFLDPLTGDTFIRK